MGTHTHTYLGKGGSEWSGVEWGCTLYVLVVRCMDHNSQRESRRPNTRRLYRALCTNARARTEEGKKKNDGTNLYRTRYAHTPFMFRTPVPPYCAFLSSSINRVLFSSDYPSKV